MTERIFEFQKKNLELDVSILSSNLIEVIGSSDELDNFYMDIIPKTTGECENSIFMFSIDGMPTLPYADEKIFSDMYGDKKTAGTMPQKSLQAKQEAAEDQYLDDVIEAIDKLRAWSDDTKPISVVFAADFWNMLERLASVGNKTVESDSNSYQHNYQYALVERLIKLCLLVIRNKNVKLFIFKDEYNSAKYYKKSGILTELELNCAQRVFLSFGNTLNISSLSQEIASYLNISPLDVCYNLSGGEVGYIYYMERNTIPRTEMTEKYLIEFVPQHFVEASITDKTDVAINIVISDGVSAIQSTPLPVSNQILSAVETNEEETKDDAQLKKLIIDCLEHKLLLEVSSIQDPIKRQLKISKFRSIEHQDYLNLMTEAIIRALKIVAQIIAV